MYLYPKYILNISYFIIGAGHIHGTLWLDLEKLSQVIDTTNPEGREAMDESVKDQIPEEYTDPKYLEELFDRIKEDNIGSHRL